MASFNVHADPTGVFFQLGQLSDSDVILTGSSNAGLADPGQRASFSLWQVSVALGMSHPTLDNLVTLQLMKTLVVEIGQAFWDAHDQLLSDEEDLARLAEIIDLDE